MKAATSCAILASLMSCTPLRLVWASRCWFQNKPQSTPHYDLTAGKRAEAVRAGAVEIDRKKTVAIIRAWREHRKPGSTQRVMDWLAQRPSNQQLSLL